MKIICEGLQGPPVDLRLVRTLDGKFRRPQAGEAAARPYWVALLV